MQWSSSNLSPRLRRRLDRLFADLNVVLAAFAIGLACLDLLGFAALSLSDEMLRQHHDRGFSAFFDISPANFATATPVEARHDKGP